MKAVGLLHICTQYGLHFVWLFCVVLSRKDMHIGIGWGLAGEGIEICQVLAFHELHCSEKSTLKKIQSVLF